MEIFLENKNIFAYREICYQAQNIRDNIDSVVPDVNDDVGRIASLSHTILLKSKDITNSGVHISGELSISVLYITENEESVSHIKLNKAFTLDYDVPDISLDSIAQINLKLTNLESRIINPRKISVSFDICGTLSVYVQEALEKDSFIAPEYSSVLKTKIETVDLEIPEAVCEKTFAVNEQYIFPSSKAEPAKLISACASLSCTDCQHVGTKLIVKGIANVSAYYISKDTDYPLVCEFSSSFSQILDTSVEALENSSVHIELNSLYFDLTETINGDHALEMELHAVIQAVCFKKQCINYVSDAYSNRVPVTVNQTKCCRTRHNPVLTEKLNVDEKLSVADECVDILCVFPNLTQTQIEDNKLRATINFDIIYRNKNSSISSIRRSCCVESDALDIGARLINCRISNVQIRPDETIVDARLCVEYTYQCISAVEYIKLNHVELNEDNPYDYSNFPSLCMVKYENESLWELAKTYHSSINKICSCNDLSDLNGNYVMIPKEY